MNEKFWNLQASNIDSVYYETRIFSPERFRIKLALNYLKNKNLHSILDVGCGTGKFLSRCNNFEKKLGIDSSDQMICVSKKKYPKIPFVRTSISNFQTNDKFDVVSAFSVIPYIKNEKNAYLKIKNLLKQNGIFIVSYPNIIFNYFTDNELTYNFMDKIFYNYITNQQLKNIELSCINKKIKVNFPKNSARGKIFLREENPLTIDDKLIKFGFKVVKKYFLNIHPVRPTTMQKFKITKNHPLYVKLQSEFKEDWRGTFLGSTFMVICTKQ